MAAHIVDIDCSGACRDEIRSGQSIRRSREGAARAEHNAALLIQFSHERRKRNRRTNPASAIAATLEAIAGCNDQRLGLAIQYATVRITSPSTPQTIAALSTSHWRASAMYSS